MNKIGLIGLCTSQKSFVSGGIRFFRKDFIEGDFIPSHAFITVGEIGEEVIVGESTDPYMRMYPLSKYANNINKRIELWSFDGASNEVKGKAIENRIAQTGKTYGYLQLFGYIWIWVGKKLGLNFSNPINIPREEPCSEYTWNYLKQIGYDESTLMGMDQNNVAPDTILTSFRKNPKCKLVAVKEYGSQEFIWLI